jgi:hypothetical protein
MAWTSGDFEGRLTARAVVAFVFGKNLARQQLVDAVKIEDVVYAAVRCKGTQRVWGIVFIVNREGKRLHVKPISENVGPFDDRCPPRILDLLSEPRTEEARNWRARCRARCGGNDRAEVRRGPSGTPRRTGSKTQRRSA